jgi:hypothetical protein
MLMERARQRVLACREMMQGLVPAKGLSFGILVMIWRVTQRKRGM